MRRGRSYWYRTLAGLALLAAGCREELGPVPKPTTSVRGFVRAGGKAVGGGWIEFLPVEGTVGDFRSAPIGPDGSFAADRVAVGVNQIGVVAATADRLLARRFQTYRSPIRRAIPGGPSTVLNLDLIEEAIRSQTTP